MSQSRLDGSVEDLYQNLQQPMGATFTIGAEGQNSAPSSVGFDPTNGQGPVFALHSENVEATNQDASPMPVVSGQESSGQESLAQSNLPVGGPLSSQPVHKVLSEDQEDTSSEHSYSTAVINDSDNSSDDESMRFKSAQNEESKIHIKMFKPQEAPPPSKMKEEATLRESFRRLRIARVGSLNKDLPPTIQRKPSLKGLKGTTENIVVGSTALRVVNEQTTEASMQQANNPLKASDISKNIITGTSGLTVEIPTMDLPLETPDTTEMKEILERLGAPPPYPGSAAPQDLSVNPHAANSSSHLPNNVVRYSDLKPSASMTNQIPSSVTVKRSSSDGSAPARDHAPLLPPRRDNLTKPRAATYNLDTKVPLSKPSMAFFPKDSEYGTSVLRTEPDQSSGEL